MAKIAFLFSGQGAQKPGMGQSWQARNEAADRILEMAERLRPGTLHMMFCGEKAQLDETINAQPALFCASLAAAEALRGAGIQPDAVAGFSLGEIPALAYSGMLSPEDAFQLVCARAREMHACARKVPGGMVAALGLSDDTIEDICAKIENVYPVNYNCPGQLVLSGVPEGIAAAREAVREAGGRTIPLATSGPFHTPLMREAERALALYLEEVPFADPMVPLYANVTAKPYEKPYAALVSRQLVSPVRWRETLCRMAESGIDTWIEVGIGSTLSGFVKKTLPGANTYTVECPEDICAVQEALKGESPC